MSKDRIVFFDVKALSFGPAWWASEQLKGSLLKSTVESLQAGDQVFVFDEDSLRNLQDAGVPQVTACVAPGASTFLSICEDAGLVMLVADEKTKEALSKQAQSRCHVLGAVGPELKPNKAPFGQVDLPLPVVVVDGRLLVDVSPTSILLQLSLVAKKVTWLVDVGLEPSVAELVREHAPAYDIDVAMFSLGVDAGQHYADSEAVVCRSQGRPLNWACSLGLPHLAVGRHPGLVACVKDSMLAVSFDALDMRRQLIPPWEQRFAEALSFVKSQATWKVHDGLPNGIEKIVRQSDQEQRGRPTSLEPSEPSGSDVEAELKALKDAIEAGER